MEQILKNKIKKSEAQSISYSDYINMALYHPEKGYYMMEKTKLGKQGDFITSNHVHHVFGKLFAKHFYEIVTTFQLPPVVCEIGGGDGRFAKAFLEEWDQISEDSSKLIYYIVETSPFHQELQNEALPIGERVYQFNSLEELIEKLPLFDGVIFSNEFFDALPVHVVEKMNNSLHEVQIGLDENENLEEVYRECSPRLLKWLDENEYDVSDGQRIEIPLIMNEVLNTLGSWLNKGFIYTVDYGYTTEEWKHPARKQGSLRGYHQHQMVENVLLYPGEMDITSHIHLDALKNTGEKVGLQFVEMLSQDKFLVRAGIIDYLQEHYDPNPFSEVSKQNRAVRSLIVAGGMSSAFHVIIQQKGFSSVHIDDILAGSPF